MKSLYVDTLVPNDVVTGQFLVLSKEIRQKKTGEPYLSLHLADRTGEMEAKMWDNVAEVMNTFDRDDFVKVKGLAQIYQNRSQFTVHRLRRLEDHEVDFGDFFPCSEFDPEQMFQELQTFIGEMSNPNLRGLLQLIFSDANIAARYKTAPAAKSIHHACRGGLLEHVLSLVRLCRLMALHYRGIDADLLVSGAILHDIGKIEELTYVRSFGYSSEGQLLGHIIIGLRMVGEKIAQMPDFPPKLRALLEHMIVSHHGELEFGSPKIPVFAEALLLHHLDNLDSKMEAMKNALKRDSQVDGEFTGWINSLERSILRKDRYLRETVVVVDNEPVVTVRTEDFDAVTPEVKAADVSIKPPAAPVSTAQPVTSPPAPSQPLPPQPAPSQPASLQATPSQPAPLQPASPYPASPQTTGAQPSGPQPGAAQPAPPAPKRPDRPAPQRPERQEHRPSAPTLFGEKLQAVLDSRK